MSQGARTKALFSGMRGRAARPDALTSYLEEPPLTTIDDPLQYWDRVLQSVADPFSGACALVRMALDFLSAPGAFGNTST